MHHLDAEAGGKPPFPKQNVASDCEGMVKDIHQGSGGLHGAIVKEVNARKDTFISCNFIREHRFFYFEAHNLA